MISKSDILKRIEIQTEFELNCIENEFELNCIENEFELNWI